MLTVVKKRQKLDTLLGTYKLSIL